MFMQKETTVFRFLLPLQAVLFFAVKRDVLLLCFMEEWAVKVRVGIPMGGIADDRSRLYDNDYHRKAAYAGFLPALGSHKVFVSQLFLLIKKYVAMMTEG